MSTDYKSTILLPKTNFKMRAGLPKLEPKLLDYWQKQNLFSRLRGDAREREKFILHDGPPYANGHLHIGTALNKVLKDIVNRSQQMMGRNAHYIPGWDCHGLPIEWQVEQEYRKSGRDKNAVSIIQFRKECRDFADKWIAIQREEFKRLGVEGDWASRYATMDYRSEAQIAREICKYLMNGGLYRGSMPVMWSVVEQTALAEAEVEYKDRTSTSVTARFKIVSKSNMGLQGAAILIWTTTPWTIPGNRAIAFGSDIDYLVASVGSVKETSNACPGEKVVLAAAVAERVKAESNISEWTLSDTFKGSDLEGLICQHPLHEGGYSFDVPLYPGNFVSTDQGTGFVHIAPGHGADDYELGQQFGLSASSVIDTDSIYLESIPMFSGKRVLRENGKEGDANAAIIMALKEAVGIFSLSELLHSYPHSWRSKAPVLFLSTPQWFISMDQNDLRHKALNAIDEVKWVPPQGRSRIYSMIENRPEWVVSRQRAWGVPITVFVNRATGEPLRDDSVNKKIFSIFEIEGSDAWFADDGSRFLGEGYNLDDWEKVNDIVDVWFESGCSHVFVLEDRKELIWPASLYLEGSDQHRGWFHSSLLEACGTRSKAPFEAVLTHGFVVDGSGRKMSKSLGNVVSPEEVISKFGADILRLWVVGSDYTDDLRIGEEILQGEVDAYRKIRNTLRYLLGNLSGFNDSEYVSYNEMPDLERWILFRIAELDTFVRKACNDFDFHGIYVALRNFCVNDLSAFYFDVRKDVFYCDSYKSLNRRAARTVLDNLFDCLTAWFAPILCFTAEEAWLARHGEQVDSVHLRQFPQIPEIWKSNNAAKKWEIVRLVRKVVTGAIEIERREKRIGSSLEVFPKVFLDTEKHEACFDLEMADICITSSIELVKSVSPAESFQIDEVSGVGVVVRIAEGQKCQRCWKTLPEVTKEQDVCIRCLDVISASDKYHPND